MTRVLFEGNTPDGILASPNAELQAIVHRNEALVFTAGRANVLDTFAVADDTLVMEIV